MEAGKAKGSLFFFFILAAAVVVTVLKIERYARQKLTQGYMGDELSR